MAIFPKQQAIETNQIPAFVPADILNNFPEPFYSHNPDSFIMQITRAICTVAGSILSNSLAQYQLNSYYSIPSASLNAFFSSLFSIASNLSPYQISLIMQGVQKGFTTEGLELIARGAMDCEVQIKRSEPCTVTVYPFLPTTARERYLFLTVVEKIQWAGAIVKFDYPQKAYRQSFIPPLALGSSSQLVSTVENEIEAVVTQGE